MNETSSPRVLDTPIPLDTEQSLLIAELIPTDNKSFLVVLQDAYDPCMKYEVPLSSLSHNIRLQVLNTPTH